MANESLTFGERELADAIAGVSFHFKIDASRLTIPQLINLLAFMQNMLPPRNPVDEAFERITAPGTIKPLMSKNG